MRKIFILFLLLLAITIDSKAQVYVDLDAVSGANDGSSWANAYTSLQTALDNASTTDTIWVAEGTYYPTDTIDGSPANNPRNKSFHTIDKDVAIYGGFAGTETAISQRDIANHPTILSGDFNDDDIVTGSGSSLLFSNNTENAYHVFTVVNPAVSTIDGFTIIGGNASISDSYNVSGSIIFNSDGGAIHSGTSSVNSEMIVNNCQIYNNSTVSWGSVFIRKNGAVNLTMNNDSIYNNKAGSGGGVYARSINSSCQVNVSESTFNGNSAGSGAALAIVATADAITTVDNSTLANNYATNDGGGIYSSSSSSSSSSSVSVSNSTISGNTATNYGGGIYSYSYYSSYYSYYSSSSVSVSNSTISGNSSIYGGGIYSYSYSSSSFSSPVSSSSVSVSNSTISGNTATNDGGGIYSYSSSSSSSSSSSTVVIGSSIVALNGNNNLYSAPGNSINSQGYNIFDTLSLTGSVTLDQLGVDSTSLNLLPLAYNGGTTQTMLPGTGSVAINMGNPTDFTDAQNAPIIDSRRDVGAAENCNKYVIDTIVACNSYTWIDGNTYTADTVGATYTYDFGACDSVVTLNLTLTTIPSDTVTNTNNDGCGSLRWVVNNVADGGTVYFDPALIDSGSDTIVLTSEIAFTKGLTFKGLYNATDTLYISGGGTNRIFYADLSTTTTKNLVLDSMVLINGNVGGLFESGGAVALYNCDSLIVSNSTIRGNTASYGGGISSSTSSTSSISSYVSVSNSTIRGNTASYEGGGISFSFSSSSYSSSSYSSSSVSISNSTISGNTAGYSGGGIYYYSSSYFSSSSSVIVSNSTISGNTASYGGGGIYSSSSSFIAPLSSSSTTASSSVNVSNSTISGNTASNSGGGIYSYSYSFSSSYSSSYSSVSVSNSTISGNTASNFGGGIYSSSSSSSSPSYSSSSSVELTSSIVWNGMNNIYNLDIDTTYNISNGYNIFSGDFNGNAVATDSSNVDSASLNLLPLAYNGGTTQTMLPGPGSIAINMGNPTDFTDAQNAPIIDSRRDVGAAENCNKYVIDTIVACNSYTWIDGNTYTADTVGATYTYDFGACDSVVTLNLTIGDTTRPTAVCQAYTAYLDAAGNASIDTNNINNGSTDNCSIDTMYLSQYTFTCANTGTNNVWLYVKDVAGNIDSCQSTVTVLDTLAPTAVCQAYTAYLDASGNASIDTANINNSSTDNCAIDTMYLSNYTYTCGDTGTHNVWLFVEDASGNIDSCSAQVTVLDTLAPILVCKNDTAYLGTNGLTVVNKYNLIGNYNTSDYTIDQTGTFNPIDISTTGTSVSLSDDAVSAALPIGFNFSFFDNIYSDFYISSNGFITFSSGPSNGCCSGGIIPNTSNPNNFIALAWEDLDPGNGGQPTINVVRYETTGTAPNRVLIVEYFNVDHFLSGNNVTTQVQLYEGTNIIEIHTDTMPSDGGNHTQGIENIDGTVGYAVPGRNSQNWSANNDFVSFIPSSIDNCGMATISLSQDSFYCADIGINNVTVTATDASGNSSNCIAVITVLDTIAPTVICKDTTIYLTAAGTVSIDTSYINNGSTDNCAIDTMYLSNYTYTCGDTGTHNVTLYVKDVSGNIDSCTAIVTVLDTLAPTAVCQAYTAYLDATGNATIDTADINNGSTDNCSIDTMYLSNYTYTCGDTGTHNVWLFVEDASGNIDSCTAQVTVLDTVSPMAMCQNIDVYLDATGNASIMASQIDNGSTDNCGIDTIYLDTYDFTCAEVGANTVTLTVEDVNGNSSTCTSTVTVIDTIAPVAQCQPYTTQLSPSGLAVVTPADIDNGSTDACGIDTMYLSQDTFSCADYGLNNITLYVVDPSGNIDSCATYIDIQDNTAPVAVCHDTTLYLDAAGIASITAADVNGGSWDSCGISSISIDKTNFTCADLGTNTVTLSVNDDKGNTGTCTATVTILDTLAPMVMCQNVTVQLDAFGTANITTADIDNGTTDNCGTATLSLSQTSFDCANLGANTVSLYATDASGNTDSCTATVTVEDNLMPTVVCRNITVQLSTAGTASIVPTDVINSMSDNCGIDTAFIDTYNFTCTNLGVNDVLVTVRDSAGNTATCTATVTVQGDSTTPQVTCNTTTVYLDAMGQASVTNADLTASASAVCGIADTTLSQYNFTCSDLGTVNVTVSVTDQNGKAGMCTAQVTVMDTFTTTVLPYSNACSGSTLTITAQAGRAGALITWYSDAAGSNILATGNPYTTAPLTASTSIWVNETYGNGCSSALVEVLITVVNGTQPTVSSNSPVCYGEDITLTADGGYVIYNWYGPNGYTSNDQNPVIATATPAESGNYYLVVQSLNGCVSDSAMTTVVVNPEVTLATALDASYTFCEDGAVEVTATLDANQSATWTGPNGFTSATETISIASANEAQHEGVYTLTVMDNSTGCTSTAVYETFIDIVPRPVLSTITGGNTTICPGESFTLEANEVSGGATYTWILPDGSTSNDNPLTVAAATQDHAGTYTVYASQGSCVSDTLTTTVSVYPQPTINIEAENDTFTQGDVIRLLATGGVSYLWSPYDYVNNPNSAEIFISDAPHGDYTYQVTAFDVNACLDSAEYSFTILPNEVLEINNVITPNGDGKNDVWVIDFLENVDVYTIRILSRNGAEVFRAEKPYNNDWGGISDEGKELPSGAYFYIIDTKDKVYTGGITIVK